VSGLAPGTPDLMTAGFLDGDAHKDLVAGADVPVSSPGWLARTSS
jgi:hypothetical protein